MNFIFKTLVIVLLGSSTLPLSAQRNFTLYHLEGTPQTHIMNPSFRPSSTVNVSFPLGMQSVGVSHSGFAINDLLHERPQDDSLEIRPREAIDAMRDLNHINIDMMNEIFGFGFRIKQNYFSFSAVNRMQFNFLYPRDLFELALEGNGRELLGERASFDGLGVNFNSYVEYNFGYNRIFNDSLMIGARVKLLSGIANLNTSRSVLGLHTDSETFDITVDGSMRVNTSNLAQFFDEDGDGEVPYQYAYNFSNRGIGIDAGVSYVMTDKLLLSASVNDLGFINWTSNTRNFVSNDVNYTFQGVDINGFLKDSLDVFDQLADSLVNVFSQTDNTDSYRTSLYTRFYIGGRYQLTDWLGATGLLYNEIVNRRYRAGLHVGLNAKLGQWLSASVNYGYYGRSWSNIGFGLSLRGGPIQYFIGVDNIMVAMNPAGAKNAHLTTGLTLMFGKPDKEKTPGSLKFM